MTASICIAFDGRALGALAGPLPEEEDDDVFLDDEEEDSGDV